MNDNLDKQDRPWPCAHSWPYQKVSMKAGLSSPPLLETTCTFPGCGRTQVWVSVEAYAKRNKGMSDVDELREQLRCAACSVLKRYHPGAVRHPFVKEKG